MKNLKYILSNGSKHLHCSTRVVIWTDYSGKINVTPNISFDNDTNILKPKIFNTIEDATSFKLALTTLYTPKLPYHTALIEQTLKTLEPKEYDADCIKFHEHCNVFHVEQSIFSKYTKRHHFCVKCGINLNGVPFGVIKHKSYQGHDFSISQKICIFCIKEMADIVETTYQNMDPEWRKEIETERFIRRL